MRQKKYSEEEVIKKIKDKIYLKNLEFIGFDGEYVNTRKTKAFVKCHKCGYIDKISVDSIINRSVGCKKCSGRVAIYDESDFIEKCDKMGYEYIGFSDGYKTGKSKLTYKCKKCGKTVTVVGRNFMKTSYRGCCYPKQHLSGKEYFNKLITTLKRRGYQLIEVGDEINKIKTTTRIAYKCEKCGNITKTSIGHVINEGTGCPGCRGGSKIDNEVIFERISDRCNQLNCTFIKFISDSNTYINNLTRVLCRCNICWCEWDSSYAHFIRDTGCPNCGGTKPLTKEVALSRAIECGKEIGISVIGFVNDEYINNESRLELVCNRCGHRWTMKYNNLMSKKGCPNCRKSKLEDEVDLLLTKSNIDFVKEKRFPWLKYKKPLSLDFYIPEYNVGVECQGLQHFKEVVNCYDSWFDGIKCTKEELTPLVEENIKRDLIKNRLCKKNGIKIFYYSNLGIDYPYQVYEDFDKMLDDIKDHSCFKEKK